MGFLQDERRQSKRTGVPYDVRAKADLSYFYTSPDSPLFCDNPECRHRLGFFRILRQALFKKQGSVYLVRCCVCGIENKRVKGALKKKFDERWDD